MKQLLGILFYASNSFYLFHFVLIHIENGAGPPAPFSIWQKSGVSAVFLRKLKVILQVCNTISVFSETSLGYSSIAGSEEHLFHFVLSI